MYRNPRLNAVTDISHARMLAIGIRISSSFQDYEKQLLLDEWEKVTFLIFGLNRKDSRFRVGDYVRIARKITKGEVDCNTAIEEIKSIARELDVEKAISTVIAEDWYDSYVDDAKYLLYRYEEYLAKKAGETISRELWEKIWGGNTATTIEHIHPKSYIDTWRGKFGRNQEEINDTVNRIGNLVLLPPGINSEAARKVFSEKKRIYSRYHLLMLNEITELEDWDKTACDDREMKIMDFMKATWG